MRLANADEWLEKLIMVKYNRGRDYAAICANRPLAWQMAEITLIASSHGNGKPVMRRGQSAVAPGHRPMSAELCCVKSGRRVNARLAARIAISPIIDAPSETYVN
jgi:hypothetical protein